MTESVNRIKNADFSAGKPDPRNWVWTTRSKGVRWQRGSSGKSWESGGITIISDRPRGTASFAQVVICKPGEFYRIEATVTCDVEAADEAAGCVVSVEPIADGSVTGGVGERLVTPALHLASKPTGIRTYYEAPHGVRRLKISVGLVNARGAASIHHVRFIRILEPDAESHVMAAPPPPLACPPPQVAKNVCVCSDQATGRPITRLLIDYFGEESVHALAPARLCPDSPKTNALLLPDPTPPSSVHSLSLLMELAADRIVVISLPAFTTLARGAVSLHRVKQDDDPIHAKVTYADYATRGFALGDRFPYAWSGRQIGSFVQNQFRKSGALKAFCKKHRLDTVLVSMCDQDATSDRPICLYRRTGRGRLFVLDIEPVEAASSTFGGSALAVHLLLSILGQSVTGLGQYVVPPHKEAEFREMIREMSLRFPHFTVHDADVPADEVTEQLVTIGRDDQWNGPPLKPKPVILVRSGLTAGDVESVYGSLLWFKQFVRMEPHTCPYADRLASRFRLAWMPCVARWEARDGWHRSAQAPPAPMTLETEPSTEGGLGSGRVAALIDVVSRPINRVRVITPENHGDYVRYATWLPQLAAAFAGDGWFSLGVADGSGFADRDGFAWRRMRYDVQIVVDRKAFESQAHRDVMAAGGQVVRIEVPGSSADFDACSIQRTDLTATLLEQVIGLQYGLIAVNRQDSPVHFGTFPPVEPGEALILDSRDPMLRVRASQAG